MKQEIFIEDLEVPPEILAQFEVNTKPNYLTKKFNPDFDTQSKASLNIKGNNQADEIISGWSTAMSNVPPL